MQASRLLLAAAVWCCGTLFTPAVVNGADSQTIARRILLPDGRPAARAKVTIRTPSGKVIYLTANADGAVRVEPTPDMMTSGKKPVALGAVFALVDAPEMAVTVSSLEKWFQKDGKEPDPLRLTTGYRITGTVVSPSQKPVPNARVAVDEVNDRARDNYVFWDLNRPGSGIATPQLVTSSGANGTFSLRPLAVEGQPEVIVRLSATAASGRESLEAAETVSNRSGSPATTTIRLVPRLSLRGRVIHALTGKPVAGARVSLQPGPVEPVRQPVVTNAAGAWEIKDLRGTERGYAVRSLVVVEHPDFKATATRASQRELPADARAVDDIQVRLRPWVTVSGRVLDEATGKPPLGGVSVNATYDEGYVKIGYEESGTRAEGSARADVAADGTFSLKVPAGNNHLSANGWANSGYRISETGGQTALDTASADVKDLVLKVRKDTGVLLHLQTVRPREEMKDYNLYLRGESRPEQNVGWLFTMPRHISTRAWGQQIEIQVVRKSDKQIIVPWKRLTADPDSWPVVLRIP